MKVQIYHVDGTDKFQWDDMWYHIIMICEGGWYRMICVTWYAKEEELDGSEYAAAHSRIAQLDIPESAEYSV